MSHKTRIVTVLLLGMLLILSACGPTAAPEEATPAPASEEAAPAPEPTAEPEEPVVLIVPSKDGPKSLCPNWQRDTGLDETASAVYSYLVTLDWGVTQGVLGYGDLAKDWEISEDGKLYTFHLYEGVRWHDGEPLTSADVKYTYDTIIEKGYPLSAYLKDVKEIRTPDDYIVEIELNELATGFIPLLAQASNWFGSILPKHLYEGTDWDTGPCSETPVGSGPFKFVEWVPDSHVVVEANDDYFRGRPQIDTIILQYVPDTNVAISMFQAGEFPYLPNHYIPSFGEIDQMMKDPEQSDTKATSK